MTAFIRHFFWLFMSNMAYYLRSQRLLARAVIGMQMAIVDLRHAFPNYDFSRLVQSVQELEDVAKDLE